MIARGASERVDPRARSPSCAAPTESHHCAASRRGCAGRVAGLQADLHDGLPVARAQRTQPGAQRPRLVGEFFGADEITQTHSELGAILQQVRRLGRDLERLVELACRIYILAALIILLRGVHQRGNRRIAQRLDVDHRIVVRAGGADRGHHVLTSDARTRRDCLLLGRCAREQAATCHKKDRQQQRQ